jgi:hypothetical protein
MPCSHMWSIMLDVNKGQATASSSWKESPKKDFWSIRDKNQWERWIRSAGLGWAGHIVRIRESDPAKKSTFELLMGERTVGRSKRRWTEEVKRENVKKRSPTTCHGGAWGERRYSSYSLLTSALNGGKRSAWRPSCATYRKRTPATHCLGCWVDPRASLDRKARGKILCLYRDRTLIAWSSSTEGNGC